MAKNDVSPTPKAAEAASGSAAEGGTPDDLDAMPEERFVEDQRALLLEEREVYTAQAEALRASADAMAAEMEPGDVQFDEESGEGHTANVDRERDLTLSAQARAAVEEIDRALAKIGAGTYGACEHCGRPIPRARLQALPHATLCVSCKSGRLSRR